jgi:hypothetical protein
MRQLVLIMILGLIPHLASASSLENALEYRLQGAWGVTRIEMRSDCAGFYNNNEVRANGVSTKASELFQPGELVHIEKIKLKSSRLDLFLKLAEPILASHMDGPFQLFDERSCKVQLILPLSRSLIRAGNPEPILVLVRERLEIYPKRQAAVESPAWNHRIRADYPPDYDQTLYEHAVWKAEQTNTAISARINQATRDALRITDRIGRGSDYLQGFADGIDSMHSWREHDCEDLINIRFSSVSKRAGRDGKDYRNGFSDGQELEFNLILADRLQGCFIPPPPQP